MCLFLIHWTLIYRIWRVHIHTPQDPSRCFTYVHWFQNLRCFWTSILCIHVILTILSHVFCCLLHVLLFCGWFHVQCPDLSKLVQTTLPLYSSCQLWPSRIRIDKVRGSRISAEPVLATWHSVTAVTALQCLAVNVFRIPFYTAELRVSV